MRGGTLRTTEIHAYETHDDDKGQYWNVWREWTNGDDAEWLLAVTYEGLVTFENVLVPMGESIIRHEAVPEPAWNEPITDHIAVIDITDWLHGRTGSA